MNDEQPMVSLAEDWYRYEHCPSGEPYDWADAARGDKPWDNEDFHVDLGCGRVKKGRIGIDHAYSPGVDLVIDLEECGPTEARVKHHQSQEALLALERTYAAYKLEADRRDRMADRAIGTTIPFGYLPFPDNSIKSVITHHCLEHLNSEGVMHVVDEVHRILEPGGLFRIIVPAYPSHAAVADPTHKTYFCEATWHTWIGSPDGPKYTDGFAEPYTQATFINEEVDMTPYPFVEGLSVPIVDYQRLWGPEGSREFRVALRKHQ